jgi:hypothetical protein
VVEIGLHDLCDHVVLEDGPSERVRHDGEEFVNAWPRYRLWLGEVRGK